MTSRNQSRTRLGRISVLYMSVLCFSIGAAQSQEVNKPNEQQNAKGVEMGQGVLKDAVSKTSKEKEILEPARFVGMVSLAYAAAKACPEVIEKLFCYCGCDYSDNHTSLLDCFTSNHGVDCHICKEEAMLAYKLHKDGVSMKEIQRTIDDQWTREYSNLGFEHESPAYGKYKMTRLYIANEGGSSVVRAGLPVESKDNYKATKSISTLKMNKEPGKCCSGSKVRESKVKIEGPKGE